LNESGQTVLVHSETAVRQVLSAGYLLKFGENAMGQKLLPSPIVAFVQTIHVYLPHVVVNLRVREALSFTCMDKGSKQFVECIQRNVARGSRDDK
jgi:hypothetical protein